MAFKVIVMLEFQKVNDSIYKVKRTYLTDGSSLTLAVMSDASGMYFSTDSRTFHNSFLGPKRPFFAAIRI